MKMNKFGPHLKDLLGSVALLLAVSLTGCGGGGDGTSGNGNGSVAPGQTAIPGAAGTMGASSSDPTVGSAGPANGATNVATSTNGPGNVLSGTVLTATFTQAMKPSTIVTPATTF